MIWEARSTPYAHQLVGVDALTKWNDPTTGRVLGGAFALFDEMGAGKTKQVIDAGQELYVQGHIHRVVVLCPAPVRSVWFDPELGELRKHLWYGVPSRVFEYHAKTRTWDFGPPDEKRLKWVITNYDYIRRPDHLKHLLGVVDKKTLLVVDESSAVKSHTAQQSRACLKLRSMCGRVVLLNGTPIANNPMDMYSQGLIMDPKILDCNFWQFKARYAVMGGFRVNGRPTQITGWINLEDMQRRFAPYVLRRLKSDCLDLPEKLPSVALTVPLDDHTWNIYKQMRDDMVAWLSDTTVSVAAQAIVKVMRLAQLTSGFLGGLEEESDEASVAAPAQAVGREKLDVVLAWLQDRWEEDPELKVLIWCRFRAEVLRLRDALPHDMPTGLIIGSQKKHLREEALRLFDPRTAPSGRAVLLGTTKTGQTGLNLTAAHTVVYVSNDTSLFTRMQSEDRVHRPGQRNVVSYFDVIATGPQGQKTVDHVILKALRDKQNLATWTTSAWVAALQSE